MSTRARVLFHRGRAAFWAALGAASIPLGWSTSVALVWFASVYANVVTDLGAAEAADDRELAARLDRIEHRLEGPRRRARARTPIPGRQAARRRLSRP